MRKYVLGMAINRIVAFCGDFAPKVHNLTVI